MLLISPFYQQFLKIISFPDNDRVFSDRLVDDHDREVFLNLLSDKLGTMLDFSYHNLCPNKVPPIFGMLLKYYISLLK